MMEKKNKKYSLTEKEKLTKLCMKYKEEYDNQKKVEKYSGKKRKFVSSSTNITGFISKAEREIHPSLRNKPTKHSERKKAIQVARRCWQSYIDTNLKEGLNEPTNKKKKFRQPSGGRKPIALEVSMNLSGYKTYGIFNSVRGNKNLFEIDYAVAVQLLRVLVLLSLSILCRIHYFI